MVRLAQITDTHILKDGQLLFGRVDTAACLKAAISYLNRTKHLYDAVLITGDLVNDGTVDEYNNFAHIIKDLQLPYYPIPGNHDDPDAMRAIFPHIAELPATGDLTYAIEINGLRVVMVDTRVPGASHGEITTERVELIDALLEEKTDTPTLIAMHHPPFMTGIGFMDEIGCVGADIFGAMIARHSQVLSIVCGHVHRSIIGSVSGTPIIISPGTAHAVTLDLDGRAGATYTLEQPAMHVHELSVAATKEPMLITNRIGFDEDLESYKFGWFKGEPGL